MAEGAASFSLIDRPWIPVLDVSGRYQRVSLAEVFAEAERIRCIAGDMPTQTLALLRLLLAVLHRAVDGPADLRTWHTLWRSPACPLTTSTNTSAISVTGSTSCTRKRPSIKSPIFVAERMRSAGSTPYRRCAGG